MSGPFGSTAWMYNAGGDFYGFPITNSLRFNDGDSAFLNFTPSPAGNRKTWTWSSWVKRSKLGATQTFIDTRAAVNATQLVHLHINGSDQLLLGNGSNDYRKTNQLFRDTSAWFHLVVAFDTTNATADNRVRIYINGGEITSFATTNNPAQDSDAGLNQAAQHCIGTLGSGSGNLYDGYLADVCLIDGTALTPSSFGETKNDIWIPKDTSGLTFGDQGWRLQFKQTGTGTASSSTIGADTSGDDNHWTSNNLVASDVMPDSPTNNFATLNPVEANDGAAVTLSEGNLQAFNSSGTSGRSFATISASSGKIYAEFLVKTVGTTTTYIGTATPFVNATLRAYRANGEYFSGSSWGSYGASYTSGDIISVEVDIDNDTLEFSKNGASQGIKTSVGLVVPVRFQVNSASSSYHVANFGQDSSFAGNETAQGNADENGIGDFYYAPPSGFLALCTANLPDPVETVDPAQGGSPQDYFNTVLYTGNGGTQSITGVGFQPDFTWSRARSIVENHVLYDSVRGATKDLRSDMTQAENTNSAGLTAFGSDGFSIGSAFFVNKNAATYVAWNWKAGTAFSNDASATGVGSIDSAGSVNTDVGFSIIKWTAVASSATQTMAHGLGAVPKMIIMKNRERAVDWAVYHESIGNTHGLELNTTDASADDSGWWNDTTPTSTVFTTGNGNGYRTGGVAEDYIAYCFAEVDGYSKFGSYTGNGSTDGPFVYTGFRPAWVMVKRTNDTGYWPITNNKTLGYNPDNNELYANTSQVEATSDSMDYLSNGFKVRWTSSEGNANGSTYIYMAFAEQPFKYANAR